MDKFTIYCTAEQTRKAFELGAPIQYASINDVRLERYIYVGEEYYVFPTAEQMIGWLEDQDIYFEIDHYTYTKRYHCTITDFTGYTSKTFTGTRKEATLAAIYAALEYLESTKQ